MPFELSPEEVRVLGTLVEKERNRSINPVLQGVAA